MGTSGKKLEINVRRLIRKDLKEGQSHRKIARHYRISSRTVYKESLIVKAEAQPVEQDNPETIGA